MAILRGATTAALVLGLHFAGASATSSSALSEAQVRAGFLYNFAVFVEWPAARASQPLIVAVLGDDRFALALKQIDGRLANGRRIVVKPVDEADDLERSSILYLSLADDRLTAAALSRVAGAPVLTVGEGARFMQIGGIVRMYTESSKLRFEINVERSQRVDLKISSKLLGLAKIFKGQP